MYGEARWLLALLSATLVVIVRARRHAEVLVIGGTGLMGVPTANLLALNGRRVTVLSRGHQRGQGTDGRRPTLPVGCSTLVCDRDDTDAFVEALCAPGCPRIIVDFTAMEPRHVEAVCRAHARRPIAHYVFVSTNMAYPGGVAAMDLSEAAQLIPEKCARRDLAAAAPANYGGNKLKCEALLEAAAGPPQSLPSSVVRPPAVVGPGCDTRHEKLHRHVAGLPPLPPSAKTRPPAALRGRRFRVACADDVAAVIAALVDRGPAAPAEAFNVASGDASGLTIDEYAAAIGAALHDAGRPVAASSVDAEAHALRNYEKQGVVDTSKAERELGFRPTSVDAFVRQTVEWHLPLLDARD